MSEKGGDQRKRSRSAAVGSDEPDGTNAKRSRYRTRSSMASTSADEPTRRLRSHSRGQTCTRLNSQTSNKCGCHVVEPVLYPDWSRLPPEMWLEILSYLPSADLNSASLTSQYLAACSEICFKKFCIKDGITKALVYDGDKMPPGEPIYTDLFRRQMAIEDNWRHMDGEKNVYFLPTPESGFNKVEAVGAYIIVATLYGVKYLDIPLKGEEWPTVKPSAHYLFTIFRSDTLEKIDEIKLKFCEYNISKLLPNGRWLVGGRDGYARVYSWTEKNERKEQVVQLRKIGGGEVKLFIATPNGDVNVFVFCAVESVAGLTYHLLLVWTTGNEEVVVGDASPPDQYDTEVDFNTMSLAGGFTNEAKIFFSGRHTNDTIEFKLRWAMGNSILLDMHEEPQSSQLHIGADQSAYGVFSVGVDLMMAKVPMNGLPSRSSRNFYHLKMHGFHYTPWELKENRFPRKPAEGVFAYTDGVNLWNHSLKFDTRDALVVWPFVGKSLRYSSRVLLTSWDCLRDFIIFTTDYYSVELADARNGEHVRGLFNLWNFMKNSSSTTDLPKLLRGKIRMRRFADLNVACSMYNTKLIMKMEIDQSNRLRFGPICRAVGLLNFSPSEQT